MKTFITTILSRAISVPGILSRAISVPGILSRAISVPGILSLVTLSIVQSAAAADLELKIAPVSVATGTLRVQLVDSLDAFDGKAKNTAGQLHKVTETGAVTLKFADLKPGHYAVMIIHDENDNGDLDTNLLGMPKEGYGFSNNPKVMRKPTFEEAKFEVKAGVNQISVDLL